jgi:hypothetical protein
VYLIVRDCKNLKLADTHPARGSRWADVLAYKNPSYVDATGVGSLHPARASEPAPVRSTDTRSRRQSNSPKTTKQEQERDLPERPYMVLKAWLGTLALKHPQVTQASRTAEGSHPYLPQ